MDIKKQIDKLCRQALSASSYSGIYDSKVKNSVLKSISDNLDINYNRIIKNNLIDLKNASKMNLKESMIDRLVLNKERILSMQSGLHEIIKISDTLYKTTKGIKQKSGITVSQMRVPLGVIGMIYESRPNVTIDSAALCIKSGNSVILRGGSESINSNKALMTCITNALKDNKVHQHTVQLIQTTDRRAVTYLLSKDKYIDVIIPRGGKGLIEKIVSCSKIPTIKHLDGNCHVYLDKTADVKRAVNISINSKTQRYGVCNAIETLLIHKKFPKKHIIQILDEYTAKGVEIRGCKNLKRISSNISLAKSKDWFEEYLSPIIAIKIVNSLEDAIDHINKYGSLHTDAVVASSKTVIDKFKRQVNSSSIMINTSTRFADGYEYGLGAEIGISTDKLHVRGPVGLEGLTNLKYIVSSQGKLRN
ncbi:MAG: glutamate-5-semialdehyde dehydrogenase [Gammaproteobacteria bacterium]|jgi:glutamate-5-semialdehyde dehydrogenase|nr:glutamate-5-semialdehyde dehydrogenase [Gammaproteobacteria bacterium]MBT4462862.1 glutamate-5-semialdehyde dehydrogenase [Gammaproteobacteria bacterium]MBT4655131.1 glutamate-5-semialdehyde dehydrogenase [Gammaproteobacteria bacterium]MBT5116717.1 glutamate-5-semialdehyde dehydrogenase [Gammaproteobacteria bacterium]MBT5761815.1 glutamate-5-semialdehyde dehydrogenase [Gammaproteobacteria bacterium]